MFQKGARIKFIFLSLILAQLCMAQVVLAQTTATPAYTGPQATIQAYLCTPTTSQTGTTASLNPNQSVSGATIPATNNTASNDLYNCINRLYRFAIVIASAGAILMIVIAGYIYMSAEGNSESVDKAKSIITTSITALVILFVGYIFLKALNPDLVQFRSIQPPSVAPTTTNFLAELATINGNATAAGGTTGTTGGTGTAGATGGASTASEDSIRQQLAAANISVNKAAPATTLVGMQQSTINEILAIKNACGSGCNITVTGGTESGHSDTGFCTHAAGYKFDLSADSALTAYIQSNYIPINTRGARGDGAKQWQSTDNAIYALETTQGTAPHWDVTAPGCSIR